MAAAAVVAGPNGCVCHPYPLLTSCSLISVSLPISLCLYPLCMASIPPANLFPSSPLASPLLCSRSFLAFYMSFCQACRAYLCISTRISTWLSPTHLSARAVECGVHYHMCRTQLVVIVLIVLIVVISYISICVAHSLSSLYSL